MRRFSGFTFIKFFPLLTLFTLLGGCAQVVSPTGGAKDVNPPILVKSEPVQGAVNFSNLKLRLTFNEYISLGDLNSQLIISPPLKSSPEVTVKNKELTILLKDSLLPNTTYTFSFGNAIVDFTERNVLENFQMVVSTGSYLDSLQLTGHVSKSVDLSNEKGVLVMLYNLEKSKQDSFPYHELPSYFSKTNELGNYTISNIKSGAYRIFALKDANANYLFDSDEELIGFKDSILEITGNAQVNMTIFQELKAKLFLKKPVKSYEGLVMCAFSKPVTDATAELLDTQAKLIWSANELSKNQDSLRFWYAGATGDSLKLIIRVNGTPFDTISVALAKSSGENSGRDKKRLVVTSSVSPLSTHDLKKPISIFLSQPISSIKRANIRFKLGKDTVPYQLIQLDQTKKRYELRCNFIEDSAYKLTLLPGAFEDFNGLRNDTASYQFRALSQRDYGTLKFSIKLPENGEQYILQVQDENNIVLQEFVLTKSEQLMLDYLAPRNYKFKLILDKNKNKKWDTGKFLSKEQAEPVFIYPQMLTVRANWDMVEQWQLDKK